MNSQLRWRAARTIAPYRAIAEPLEWQEHPLPGTRGDSGAAIDDPEVDEPAAHQASLDPYGLLRWRPREGVGHQVRDRALDEGCVGRHHRQGVRYRDQDPLGPDRQR